MLQAVYDLGNLIRLPQNYAIMAHAGPGFTFVKPLGDYTDNKESFLNAMAGLEFHYGISQSLSLFLDTSYIYALVAITIILVTDLEPLTETF